MLKLMKVIEYAPIFRMIVYLLEFEEYKDSKLFIILLMRKSFELLDISENVNRPGFYK